MVIGDKNGSS